MALRGFTYPAPAKLIKTPTAYKGSSGTDLGIIGIAHEVGFDVQYTRRTSVRTGGHTVGGKITALNLIYRIILLDHSDTVMDLLHHGAGMAAYKMGHPIEHSTGMTHPLLIRPSNEDKPFLYMPRAFVFSLGPVVWDRRQNIYDSTQLLIEAHLDAADKTHYYGDPANFPALS